MKIVKQHILDAVRKHPGITTPELADILSDSVSIARWAVHQCPELEFYEGNRIRFKKRGSTGEQDAH